MPSMPSGQPCSWDGRPASILKGEKYKFMALQGSELLPGFVFTEEDPYIGIDLDACLTPEGPAPWAQQILEKFKDTYVEVSRSGTGLHIVCEVAFIPNFNMIKRGNKVDGGIEIMGKNCFMVMTMKGWPPNEPLKPVTDYTDEVCSLIDFLRETKGPIPKAFAQKRFW